MMKFTLSHTVSDEQVRGLFKLFLHRENGRYGKKLFVDYIKEQVGLFGTDEFLTSTNTEEIYDELTEYQCALLRKWKLIE